MAIIKGAFEMTGSIKGVSFYKQRGSDKVIMRTKGGASKEKIKKSPKFAELRKHQKEWSGCTRFGSGLRLALGGLNRLADFNLTSVFNGTGKNLQKLDTEYETGQRRVQLSKLRSALDGFSFNRNYPFNSVLRIAPEWKIDRYQLKATVTIPRVNTDTDLLNIQRLPFFRIILVLGTVSDTRMEQSLRYYEPAVAMLHGAVKIFNSEWYSTNTIIPEQGVILQFDEDQIAKLTDEVSVLLSVAVEFGAVGFTGQPTEVKYAGCGKILGVR